MPDAAPSPADLEIIGYPDAAGGAVATVYDALVDAVFAYAGHADPASYCPHCVGLLIGLLAGCLVGRPVDHTL